MSQERNDSDRREDDQPTETNDVETGVNNDGMRSMSNEDRPADEDYGGGNATATETVQTSSKSEDDSTGYFGPRQKRLYTFCFLFLWFCIFVLPRWDEYKLVNATVGSSKDSKDWEKAYQLSVGGAVVILMAVIAILAVVFCETRSNMCDHKLFKTGIAAVLAFGGFLYWVGGIELAYSINNVGGQDSSHKYHLSGYAGTAFIEATFVALLAGIVGVDLVFNWLSKSERFRLYLVLNTLLSFTSLVAFFSYAVWRGYPMYKVQQTGCVAAGWFFVFVSCIYWYCVEFQEICCKCSASAQRCARESATRVRIAGVILLLFGGFLIFAGMWSLGNTSDKKYNCYYVGYGFFVMFFTCIMALDFHLGRVIEKRA